MTIHSNAARTVEEKEDKESWVIVIDKKFELYDPFVYRSVLMKKCIYRWPNDLIISSGIIWHYTPHMASFGPYHHGKEHLQPMEHHKERALYSILERSGASLSSLVNSLKDVEQVLRGSYDNLDPNLSSDSFLRMMLLDGCFLLELLRIADANRSGSALYEPVFSRQGKLASSVIQRDMLMLENQIPFLVLKKLMGVEEMREINNDAYLNHLIFNHYGFEQSLNVGPNLHVLDAYRKCLIMCSTGEEQTPPSTKGFNIYVCSICQPWLHAADKGLKSMFLPISTFFFRFINERISKPGQARSATAFHEAGIKFSKRTPHSGLKITFDDEKGVLTLPYIEIEEYTAAIYMNLMAFERMHPELCQNQEVTSYVAFMDDLISTAEDVSLLCSQGIMRNHLGSDEDATKVFNKLGDRVVYRLRDNLDKQLQSYIASDWNVIKAYAKHNQSIMPLLVAAIGLVVWAFDYLYRFS